MYLKNIDVRTKKATSYLKPPYCYGVMVEVPGFEPGSPNLNPQASTCLFCFFSFSAYLQQKGFKQKQLSVTPLKSPKARPLGFLRNLSPN